MEYINAFWVGGAICALVQILLDRTKLMPGRVMVLLVCTGAVLGFLGIYQPFAEFAGGGASVPLLGFGNTLWNGVKEAVEEEGFIGIFLGGVLPFSELINVLMPIRGVVGILLIVLVFAALYRLRGKSAAKEDGKEEISAVGAEAAK